MLEAESENMLTRRKRSQRPGMQQRHDAWLDITTATRTRDVYLHLAQHEVPRSAWNVDEQVVNMCHRNLPAAQA